MSNAETKIPDVFITPLAKRKLDLYIAFAEGEISGLGEVAYNAEEMSFLITDIMLFEQKATGASTDLSEEAIANFIVETVQAGKNPSNFRVWWHSHADMGTFWSTTDTDTMERFKNEWMISIVGNKNGEYLVRIDQYRPYRLSVDKLSLQLDKTTEEEDELAIAIKADIEAKVTVVTLTTHFPYYKGKPNSETGQLWGGKGGMYGFDGCASSYAKNRQARGNKSRRWDDEKKVWVDVEDDEEVTDSIIGIEWDKENPCVGCSYDDGDGNCSENYVYSQENNACIHKDAIDNDEDLVIIGCYMDRDGTKMAVMGSQEEAEELEAEAIANGTMQDGIVMLTDEQYHMYMFNNYDVEDVEWDVEEKGEDDTPS